MRNAIGSFFGAALGALWLFVKTFFWVLLLFAAVVILVMYWPRLPWSETQAQLRDAVITSTPTPISTVGILLSTPVPLATATITPEALSKGSAEGGVRPVAWIPDNERDGSPICDWGIPSGTVIDRQWPVKLTNCTSFNQQGDNEFTAEWRYGSEDYEFLLEDWDSNPQTKHKGAGWWGPLDRPDVFVMVWYGNQQDPCVGTSFEIKPDVGIRAKFINQGTIPGVWSQGAILTYEPECRVP